MAPESDPFTLPEPWVRALVQTVLTWRRQGKANRWSTPPSVALVKIADSLHDKFPALCAELESDLPADAGTPVPGAAGTGTSEDLLNTLDYARRLLQRWWLSEPPPMGSVALREHTRIFLEQTHRDVTPGSGPTRYDRTLDLLRRFVAAWNATEASPRGERVDMDLLREVADAFEREDGNG